MHHFSSLLLLESEPNDVNFTSNRVLLEGEGYFHLYMFHGLVLPLVKVYRP